MIMLEPPQVRVVKIPDSNARIEMYMMDCAGQSIFNQVEQNKEHYENASCVRPPRAAAASWPERAPPASRPHSRAFSVLRRQVRRRLSLIHI